LTAAAIKLVPSSLLWTATARAALTPSSANNSGLEALAHRLLGELVAGALEPAEAGAWLAAPALAAWWLAANPWGAARPFLSRPPNALRRTILATAHARDLSTHAGPVRPLAILLSRAWGDELTHNTRALIDLLPAPAPGDPGDLLLRA